MRTAACFAIALVVVTAAGALNEPSFRYVRDLDAPAGAGPIRFEPDGVLYAHAHPDLGDLRVLDSSGVQVPWRTEPDPQPVPSTPVELLSRGRRGGVVSVLLDRGVASPPVDRIELVIPDLSFVGNVEVLGSSRSNAGFARLSTTPIYSVRGAVDARSTTAAFPATDLRFLLVRARGVSAITGASVARDPAASAPLHVVNATQALEEPSRQTIVTLDLGHRKVPVDGIRVRSQEGSYDRPVAVEGSNDGTTYTPVGNGRLVRIPEVAVEDVIALSARHRFLRLTIENGDDEPLVGLNATALARSRPLLVEGGHATPLRVFYGAALPAPQYDFAQLPLAALELAGARKGSLGVETHNPVFEAALDTRSFFERHPGLVSASLVFAALIVAAGGLLALRKRTA